MNRKLMGVALTRGGLGMLLVIVVPWWGFIVAFILALIGIIMLSNC